MSNFETFVPKEEPDESDEDIEIDSVAPVFTYDQERGEAIISFADTLYELKHVMLYEPDKTVSILKGEEKTTGAAVEIEVWEVNKQLTVVKVSEDGDVVYDASQDSETVH